jgi:hypothetical protein
MQGEVGDDRVVAAPEVLHEPVPAAIVRAEANRLSPRIGRSRAWIGFLYPVPRGAPSPAQCDLAGGPSVGDPVRRPIPATSHRTPPTSRTSTGVECNCPVRRPGTARMRRYEALTPSRVKS